MRLAGVAVVLACLLAAHAAAAQDAPSCDPSTVGSNGWCPWGQWGNCSTTGCGTYGLQLRRRVCAEGYHCSGNNVDAILCHTGVCSIDGGWSAWTEEPFQCPCTYDASVVGQLFVHSRSRVCNAPPPSGPASVPCQGSNTETLACAWLLCYAGTWGDWTDWSACSVSCGSGTQVRSRSCFQEHGHVVDYWECPGGQNAAVDAQSCTTGPCVLNGVCPGNLVLNTDSDLARLDGCVYMDAGLNLTSTTITTLEPLRDVTFIGGSVVLSGNAELSSIEGLRSLNTVDGNVVVEASIFSDLYGLRNLSTVASDLTVTDNPALYNLRGLALLNNVGGSVLIKDNAPSSPFVGSLAELHQAIQELAPSAMQLSELNSRLFFTTNQTSYRNSTLLARSPIAGTLSSSPIIAFPPMFPGLRYLGLGYDYLAGNPLPRTGIDPGYRQPVFELSYRKSTLLNDGIVAVPDHVNVRRCSSQSIDASFSQITTSAEQQHELRASVVTEDNQRFGLPIGPKVESGFSLNAQFQAQSEVLSASASAFIRSSAIASSYEAKIRVHPSTVTLSDAFQKTVRLLPTSLAASAAAQLGLHVVPEYTALVRRFGSHVVDRILMGGRAVRTYTMSSSQFSEFQSVMFSSSDSSNTGVSITPAFNANAGSDQSSALRLAVSQMQASTNITSEERFYGGIPAEGSLNDTDFSALNEWAESVVQKPVPISTHVTPLAALLTRSYFPDDLDIVKKQTLLLQTLTALCQLNGGVACVDTDSPPDTLRFGDLVTVELQNMQTSLVSQDPAFFLSQRSGQSVNDGMGNAFHLAAWLQPTPNTLEYQLLRQHQLGLGVKWNTSSLMSSFVFQLQSPVLAQNQQRSTVTSSAKVQLLGTHNPLFFIKDGIDGISTGPAFTTSTDTSPATIINTQMLLYQPTVSDTRPLSADVIQNKAAVTMLLSPTDIPANANIPMVTRLNPDIQFGSSAPFCFDSNGRLYSSPVRALLLPLSLKSVDYAKPGECKLVLRRVLSQDYFSNAVANSLY